MGCMEEYLVVQFNVNEIWSCFNKCLFSIKKKKRAPVLVPLLHVRYIEKECLTSSLCQLYLFKMCYNPPWSPSFHRRVEFRFLPWTRLQNVNVREKSQAYGPSQIQWCQSDTVTQHEDRKRFAAGIASSQGRNHCEVSSRASEAASERREEKNSPLTPTRYEKRQRGKMRSYWCWNFLETSNVAFVRKGPKLFNLHFLNTYSLNIVWSNV